MQNIFNKIKKGITRDKGEGEVMQQERQYFGANDTKLSSVDKASLITLLLVVFLLPLFFLPFFNLSLGASKGVLLTTLTTIAFFLWLIARLKDGVFLFPRSIILGSLGAVPLAFLISTVFSPVRSVSFTGFGFEVGTFSTIFVLSILAFLAAVFFQSKEKIFRFYGALFISAFAIFVFQIVRMIWLSFGLPLANIFASLPANLVGKWADMAILFGFVAILALLTLELLTLPKRLRIYVHIVLWTSLLLMLIVNFYLAWIILGFFALVVLVYTMSFGRKDPVGTERTIPAASFGVVLVSLFFVLASGLVSGPIFSVFGVPQEVVSPSWSDTGVVIRESLAENPIVGSGPNRFTNSWLIHKPESINNTALWNADFSSGVGLVPSFVVTTGALGLIAFLVFFAAFLYRGIMSVFVARPDSIHNYLTISSFLGAVYLWIFNLIYVPNIVIFGLAFMMTGVFVASLVVAGRVKNHKISFLEDPRVGFISMLVLILLIMSSVAGGYVLFQKFISVTYFQKSLTELNVDGNLDKAEQSMVRAIRLGATDTYYRNLAEMNIIRLRTILNTEGISEDNIRTQFQTMSQVSIQNALLAVQLDETNYQNWITLARVYEFLISFAEGEEFYTSAKENYENALERNPKSPAIVLLLARLEISNEDLDSAKKYIVQALNMKNNYTEAIFLLSQIQASEGELEEAIALAEIASRIAPNDIGIYFQLGLLKYQNKDYQGAVGSFENSVILNPTYSNAKYFLGLSYDRIGESDKAIGQFEDVLLLNPENEEIDDIIKNLKAGRAPFANVPSSVKAPEDREELPIDEGDVEEEE